MTKGTVLVVDDDPEIVEVLAEALADDGYAVLAAVDGAALRVAHEAQPDVILLDIMMPNMDGIEVSTRLHADPQTAHIPIIAMSAYQQMDTLEEQMGAQGRLRKPFEFKEMYALIARCIPSG
jgi:CheY-like chemotaxis protein